MQVSFDAAANPGLEPGLAQHRRHLGRAKESKKDQPLGWSKVAGGKRKILKRSTAWTEVQAGYRTLQAAAALAAVGTEAMVLRICEEIW
jgi:hypothetical protein